MFVRRKVFFFSLLLFSGAFLDHSGKTGVFGKFDTIALPRWLLQIQFLGVFFALWLDWVPIIVLGCFFIIIWGGGEIIALELFFSFSWN